MLKYIKSNKVEPIENIRNRFDGCKVLVIELDETDVTHLQGKVYAVSETVESYDEIYAAQRNLAQRGVTSTIVGCYGDDINVQCFM